MTKRITKADVLQGKSKVVEVEVPELGGSIFIRPLTDGEYSQIQALTLQQLKLDGKASLEELRSHKIDLSSLDMAKMVEGQKRAERMTVAFAIVPAEGEEPWTEEDVAALPAGVPERIAKKVYEITGIGNAVTQAVSSFRKKS